VFRGQPLEDRNRVGMNGGHRTAVAGSVELDTSRVQGIPGEGRTADILEAPNFLAKLK